MGLDENHEAGSNPPRRTLRKILPWPFEDVLMARGAPAEKDGKAAVARALCWRDR
jgi:hypothetical protein